MVATRDVNTTSFVLQGTTIPCRDISAEDWLDILEAEMKDLPLSYLRDFHSMGDVVCGSKGSFTRIRRAHSEVIRESLPASLSPTSVFLPVWESKVDFLDYRLASHLLLNERKDIPKVFQQYLLLSRRGAFYLVSALWKPSVHWDERYHPAQISDFWYELERILIQQVSGSILGNLLANGEGAVAVTVRRSIENALESTKIALEGNLKYVVKVKSTMRSRTERIDFFV